MPLSLANLLPPQPPHRPVPNTRGKAVSDTKRLLWRCRRGTKELDEILTRFVVHHLDTLSAVERQQFDALLNTPDPQLSAWLLGTSPPPDQATAHLVARILSTD